MWRVLDIQQLNQNLAPKIYIYETPFVQHILYVEY